MGEKYDSCYDEYPVPYRGTTIPLARVSSPVGPGFPPDDLAAMLAGGPTALDRVSRYADRASSTIVKVASRASETLQQAGADPAAKLAAGQQVVSQLQGGLADVQQQVAQSNVTLQMLEDAATFEPTELVP